jgi:hypothetical protein
MTYEEAKEKARNLSVSRRKEMNLMKESHEPFYCAMEQGDKYKICNNEEARVLAQDGWKLRYSCQADFNCDIIEVADECLETCINIGWEKKLDDEKHKCICTGFHDSKNKKWYHPDMPPQELIERIKKAFEEVILKPQGYSWAKEPK